MQTNSITSSLKFLLAAGCVAALGSSALADTAKFYTGMSGYGGPFNGAGTVYAATSGLGTNCPTVGVCNADNVQATEIFATSVQVTATAGTGQQVWGDFSPAFGGLGVQTTALGSSDDDQITGGEVLHLHFASAVTLTGIGTLFDPAHAPFGFDPTTTIRSDYIFIRMKLHTNAIW